MGDHIDLIDDQNSDVAVDHVLPHALVEDVLAGPVEVAFDAVARLIAWAEAQRLRLIAGLRESGRSPFELLDDTSVHITMAGLNRAERRVNVLALFPTFADALAAGDISVGHVDRLGDALRRLLDHERELLAADHVRLLLTARAGSASRYGRFLAREVARFEKSRPVPESAEGDPAEARFAAQRAGIRLTSQRDRDTGMTVYRWALDPLRALQFDQRLAARVEALHHGPPIAGCPDDPLERQAFLRALALWQLTEQATGGTGTGSGSRGAEVIVVVDHTAPGEPDIDWGHPVDIPKRVLDDLLGRKDTKVVEVVVRNGTIVSAPGSLDLGRTTRLANRAQRRALRALYRGCGMPGCDVSFDRCTIHHVVWWRHGGRTDLCNLLPVCNRHHHLIHDRGWQLSLGPNRELTIVTPSGRVMTTG
ncbi:MAG: HNH endonuclease signature motif containing protein, partial [Ilumatobacteraceae bacterium]